MSGLRVLHVEDDHEIAAAVAVSFSSHGYAIVSVTTAADARAIMGQQRFDVVVLDRMLPDESGIDLLRGIREQGHRCPVLMLSALGRSIDRVEGLDAGVDDYLAKPYDPDELLARVRAVYRRANEPDPGALITYGSLQCHPKARTAYVEGQFLALSPKEYRLLRFLLDHAGEPVTRSMLLKHVWNLDFDPQTNVVDVSVSRLRRKLEGAGSPARPTTIETVWGSGYRLVTT